MFLPYLVWSILYLAKDYMLNGNISIRHIIYSFCFGKAATPFYYIVVMVQLTVLTPWLVKLKSRRYLYAVTPAYLTALYIFNIVIGDMPRLYETLFPAWFLFYILGMDCRDGKWDNVISKIRRGCIPIALCVSLIEAEILLKAGCSSGFAASQIKISSFIYTIAIALALMKDKDKKQDFGMIKSIFTSIGECSYGIFYIHMLVLLVARKILSFTWISQVWVLNFLMCFLLTACGSYVIVLVVKKLSEKYGMQKYL